MILKINYGNSFDSHRGSIEIDLEHLCKLEGKKELIEDSSGVRKKVISYPIAKARKLFKLICENCSDDEIEQVQSYFELHNKKYYQEFRKIKEKGRW